MSRRVLVLIDPSAYCRDVLAGIVQHAGSRWDLRVDDQAQVGRDPRRLAGFAGVIGLIRLDPTVAAVRAAGIPAVNVGGAGSAAALTSVCSDNAAIGRLAARHLGDRGYRRFAIIQRRDLDWERLRRESFMREVGDAEVTIFPDDPGSPDPAWEEAIGPWLRRLPHPLAVFAQEQAAVLCLQAARASSLRVPEDIAVLGVDVDDALARLCDPPLSIIRHDARRIGREAARALGSILDGGRPPPVTMIAPLDLVERVSTDHDAVDDPQIAMAMRWLRAHAGRGCTVAGLLRQVPLSRSSLERGFACHLGCGLGAFAHRIRMDTVRRLLIETDLPMRVVAAETGYRGTGEVARAVKAAFGCAPSQIRKRG